MFCLKMNILFIACTHHIELSSYLFDIDYCGIILGPVIVDYSNFACLWGLNFLGNWFVELLC